ncbi:hypothetical protein BHU62_22135 [Serratia marcescens]|uniref:Type VI secretion protein n=1 Tax=Serratia marcescens TaxID=615 RepID=A0A1Q4NUF9_SERMA|nr:hypothetical protein [Serratia marcescens]OKB64508.1 hypothetical protein BHU62_22135 [Serratia marcescens]
MGWERKRPIISKSPEEPSLVLWLGVAIVALIMSILLFVLHANQRLGSLQAFNIWILSATPLVTWFTLICLRGWLYNLAFNRYKFETDEAEYAQQQWSAWAGRYLAVLHNVAFLPGSLTAAQLIQPPPGLERRGQQTRHIPWGEAEGLTILLGDVSDALLQLPADLPLNATFLTDSPRSISSLRALFDHCWKGAIPTERPAPKLNIRQSHSLLILDEHLKSPEISAELVLVQQLQGGEKYSDALIVLLLVSDDVATKYQFKHDVRLLRPMGLDTSRLSEELALYFSTQTLANSTQFIAGDQLRWADDFFELLKASETSGGYWKTEQVQWLETFSGISGPFSPWVMAAVSSDIVRLQRADCLMLSADEEQSFITTVTTGKQNNENG